MTLPSLIAKMGIRAILIVSAIVLLGGCSPDAFMTPEERAHNQEIYKSLGYFASFIGCECAMSADGKSLRKFCFLPHAILDDINFLPAGVTLIPKPWGKSIY